MPDPMLVAVAAAVAGKVTESLAPGMRSALGDLIKLVRKRFARDDAAQAALAAAEKAPADDDRVAALAAELERLASAEPKFAEQLRAAWSRIDTTLQAHHGGTINEVSGTVSGHLVQARDISGGVRFDGPARN
jgi:hypothetical protein